MPCLPARTLKVKALLRIIKRKKCSLTAIIKIISFNRDFMETSIQKIKFSLPCTG